MAGWLRLSWLSVSIPAGEHADGPATSRSNGPSSRTFLSRSPAA